MQKSSPLDERYDASVLLTVSSFLGEENAPPCREEEGKVGANLNLCIC